MSDQRPQHDFLTALTEVIEQNMSNELFGVSELAEAMNMSRSNLLRKVKKETQLSVSQLISQARLKRAMMLLRSSQLNVSEVSVQVGFNSTSYFIKCFRAYYGYPPGEVGKRDVEVAGELASEGFSGAVIRPSDDPGAQRPKAWLWWKSRPLQWIGAVVLLALIAAAIGYSRRDVNEPEKSIAVLPFANESSDSSNVYLINGLMDATLNNLHRIRSLHVVSRNSSEKYRRTGKSIPEIATELKAQYFVTGSGQKLGDRILLNIQLIDAETDKQLWSRQYRRDVTDIFELQEEIAGDIVREIKVIVTNDEKSDIRKKPTADLQAYEYYLQGREHFYKSGPGDLNAAASLFLKAIERDPQFALAYAHLTMVYYYLDFFNVDKKHTSDIEDLADKAILYDPHSSESLVAKALSFAQRRRYDLAIPYLERALDYDPRSGVVLHFLNEFCNIYVPDPTRYLMYAIQKAQVDRVTDSTTAAFNYFHLSYALFQNGFFNESALFINRSLALNPNGFFSRIVKPYIMNIEKRQWTQARDALKAEYKLTPSRFDILHEVGKTSIMLHDYATARICFDSALSAMHRVGLDIVRHDYLYIGSAYEKTGDPGKAAYYIREFKSYADNDLTMYKDLNLAMYYLYTGDKRKGLDLITRFAEQQDNFNYLVLLCSEDPDLGELKNDPAFRSAMDKISTKFWRKHARLENKWREVIRELEQREPF